MTRPIRIEMDCSTGIESIIELTDEEIAHQLEMQEQVLTERLEREAAAEAKAAAQASAKAKLAALGLTAEEIAAL